MDFDEGYAMIYDNNDDGFHCLTHVYMTEECQVTEIFVPDNVEYIEANAFSGCSGLVSIALPNSVYGIGANAFGGCTSLENLAIPETVQVIDPAALGDCSVVPFVTPGSPAET